MKAVRSTGGWGLILVSAAVLGGGCSGEPLTRGLTEPLRLEGAQFFEGELPGEPPLTTEQQQQGAVIQAPNVTGYDINNQLILPGEPEKSLRGHATPSAAAIGVRLEGEGSGYWLLPTGLSDALNQDELLWGFEAAFNPGLSPGRKRLLLAGIGADGKAGTQTAIELCIRSSIPDNDNACDPKRVPPALVVSLAWDAPVDLDLRVVTPGGKVVDAKHPSTALPDADGDLDLTAPGLGLIDRDSNAGCNIDGHQRESLVFQELPASGRYLVYANLFDACGEPAVRFDLSYYTAAVADEPETFEFRRGLTQAGALQAVQANGGAKRGMYVTDLIIP